MKNLLERFGNWYFDSLDRIENKALQSLVVTISLAIAIVILIFLVWFILFLIVALLGNTGIGILLFVLLFSFVWFTVHTVINNNR